MRLNMHAKLEIGIIAIVLLGSCGENATRRFTEGDFDRIDVADVNARNAIYRVNELESRVEEIELQLSM